MVFGKFSVMEAKFFRFLKIVGFGFKARAKSEGPLLYLRLGYSHEVELAAPPAVRVFCFKNKVICYTGLDKHRVHQFAAAVRSCKPPEVHNGKGIMYADEVIKKKQGKKEKIYWILRVLIVVKQRRKCLRSLCLLSDQECFDSLLCKTRDAVLDLACEKGHDLIKWDKERVGCYVGVDIADGLEDSVATILYLISLQDLTNCPF